MFTKYQLCLHERERQNGREREACDVKKKCVFVHMKEHRDIVRRELDFQ